MSEIELHLRYVEDLKIEANGTYSVHVSFKVNVNEFKQAVDEAKERAIKSTEAD